MTTQWTLAFLTDYGYQDLYAGLLKGVALSLLTPQARAMTTLIDLTHGIPAHQVALGGWQLAQAIPYLPPHTVVVAVVDPAVGNSQQRHLLAIRADYQQVFIAPDNGLLDPVLRAYACSVWSVEGEAVHWQPPGQSVQLRGATFAGRDFYTPLAATLLNALVAGEGNAALARLGTPIHDWRTLPEPTPVCHPDGSITGNLLFWDGFGNGITNLPLDWLVMPTKDQVIPYQLNWEGRIYPLQSQATYQPAPAEQNGVLLVAGSHGYWELAAAARSLSAILPENADPERSFKLLPL